MSLTEITYCTESEADLVIGENDSWEDLESEEKVEAIEWASIYMQTHYSIPVQSSTISQGLINANALIALEHAQSSVFTASNDSQPEKGLVETKVKADVVESVKKYDPNVSNIWRDPYPHVTAMLKTYGFPMKKTSGGVAQVSMIRR